MTRITFVFALLLVALGLGLWLGTGRESVTALIPAFLGIALGLCGLLALKPAFHMHAMHAAVLLALLGLGGAVPGVLKVIGSLGGEALERPEAAWGQTAMAVLCALFVALGVRSFVQARRNRKAAEQREQA